MRLLALFLIVAAACTDESGIDHPIEPAGAPGVTGGGGGAAMVSGRVCVLTDFTRVTTCATGGAGGLTVALGGSTATTAADGTFALPAPTGSLLSYTVAGPGAVTTATPFSPSPLVPVIDSTAFADMLAANEITLAANTGSILGTVVRGGKPAVGVSVGLQPAAAFSTFYDTPLGIAASTGTGQRGVFLVPGVTAGTASSIAFTPGETDVDGIQVVDGGVTILDSMNLP